MEKIIDMDGKQIKFKSTAGTLMRYRNNFGRDFIKDIVILDKKFKNVKSGMTQFELVDLDILISLLSLIFLYFFSFSPFIFPRMYDFPEPFSPIIAFIPVDNSILFSPNFIWFI